MSFNQILVFCKVESDAHTLLWHLYRRNVWGAVHVGYLLMQTQDTGVSTFPPWLSRR
jgi:hypothetical protein